MLSLDDDDRSEGDRRDGRQPARQPIEKPRKAAAREHRQREDDDRCQPRGYAHAVEAWNVVVEQEVRTPRAWPHRKPDGKQRHQSVGRHRPQSIASRRHCAVARGDTGADDSEHDHREAVEQLPLAPAVGEEAAQFHAPAATRK